MAEASLGGKKNLVESWQPRASGAKSCPEPRNQALSGITEEIEDSHVFNIYKARKGQSQIQEQYSVQCIWWG